MSDNLKDWVLLREFGDKKRGVLICQFVMALWNSVCPICPKNVTISNSRGEPYKLAVCVQLLDITLIFITITLQQPGAGWASVNWGHQASDWTHTCCLKGKAFIQHAGSCDWQMLVIIRHGSLMALLKTISSVHLDGFTGETDQHNIHERGFREIYVGATSYVGAGKHSKS